MNCTESAARCPTCDGAVPFATNVVIAELLKCLECGTELEVTSINPPGVAEAPMEEEDWGQ